MLGEVIGNFRIIAKLAVGGMGAVYRAEHPLLGKSAAVKVLLPEHSNNRKLINRLFTEARSATAARHPGIVEIYDFGYLPSGSAYIVMELLDGQALSSVLVARGRLPEPEALSYTRGIASALAAAHAQGIIHRDLKPDNIFLVRDPDMIGGVRPKILDFGIAKVAQGHLGGNSDDTRLGSLIGTPTYMSPEQCRGIGKVDQRSDLYAVGCLLYEMLVGRPPFVSEGIGEVLSMHINEPPTPPSEIGVPVSNSTESLLLGLLQKRPRDRVQSAAELTKILSHALTPGSEDPTVTGLTSEASSSPVPSDASAPVTGEPEITSIATDQIVAMKSLTPPPPEAGEIIVDSLTPVAGEIVSDSLFRTTFRLHRSRRGILAASFGLTLAAGAAAIFAFDWRGSSSAAHSSDSDIPHSSPLPPEPVRASVAGATGVVSPSPAPALAPAPTVPLTKSAQTASGAVVASPPSPVAPEAPSPKEVAEISELIEMSPPPARRPTHKAARRPPVAPPGAQAPEQQGAPTDAQPAQQPTPAEIDRGD